MGTTMGLCCRPKISEQLWLQQMMSSGICCCCLGKKGNKIEKEDQSAVGLQEEHGTQPRERHHSQAVTPLSQQRGSFAGRPHSPTATNRDSHWRLAAPISWHQPDSLTIQQPLAPTSLHQSGHHQRSATQSIQGNNTDKHQQMTSAVNHKMAASGQPLAPLIGKHQEDDDGTQRLASPSSLHSGNGVSVQQLAPPTSLTSQVNSYHQMDRERLQQRAPATSQLHEDDVTSRHALPLSSLYQEGNNIHQQVPPFIDHQWDRRERLQQLAELIRPSKSSGNEGLWPAHNIHQRQAPVITHPGERRDTHWKKSPSTSHHQETTDSDRQLSPPIVHYQEGTDSQQLNSSITDPHDLGNSGRQLSPPTSRHQEISESNWRPPHINWRRENDNPGWHMVTYVCQPTREREDIPIKIEYHRTAYTSRAAINGRSNQAASKGAALPAIIWVHRAINKPVTRGTNQL
ncbi:uncharacterized protein [Narcine bancroftii]|uniref:uncharacterized protein isoform X2 n=1 Tax=Narcine bancroftii TaxID=1343680 RepID=UPI00383163B4